MARTFRWFHPPFGMKADEVVSWLSAAGLSKNMANEPSISREEAGSQTFGEYFAAKYPSRGFQPILAVADDGAILDITNELIYQQGEASR